MFLNSFRKHRSGVAIALLVALGSASSALADGMTRGSLKDDVGTYSWRGFYFGLHAGYAWGEADYKTLTDVGVINACCGHPGIDLPAGSRFDSKPQGGIGGIQLGYNWQSGPMVFGIEGTFSGGQLRDTKSFSAAGDFGHPAEQTLNARTEIDWMATLVGRLGYASGSWLVYGKGGYATASVETNVSGSAFDPAGLGGTVSLQGSADSRHHGWTVGGGLEYMIVPNVILGVEYNYLNLGNERHSGTFSCTNGTGTCPFTTVPLAANVDLDIHTVMARLSFQAGK